MTYDLTSSDVKSNKERSIVNESHYIYSVFQKTPTSG